MVTGGRFSLPHSRGSRWIQFSEYEERQRANTAPESNFRRIQESPLNDLAPIALPGIGSRLVRPKRIQVSDSRLSIIVTDVEAPVDEELSVSLETSISATLLWGTALSVLPSFQYGWIMSSVNTPAAAMRFDLGLDPSHDGTDGVWGLIIGIFSLGGMIGCSVGASIADSVGRKAAILAMSGAYAIGCTLQAASYLPVCDHAPCLYEGGTILMLAGRFIVGLAAGATTVVVPLYLGEIAQPQLRGALGALFSVVLGLAQLISQICGLPTLMGSSHVWPVYLLLNLLPTALQFVFVGLLPESPRWLAGASSNASHAEITKAVAKLRGFHEHSQEVIDEVQSMRKKPGNDSHPGAMDIKPGALDLVRDHTLRRSLVLGVVALVVQQFSGITNAFNYSSIVLRQNGLDETVIMTVAVLMMAGNLLVSIAVVFLMTLTGRRVLILSSASGMAISLGGLTVALMSPGYAWTAPLAVASIVFFVMFFGLGMGPIPWLLPSEVLPVEYCAAGSSIAASCNWFSNFIIGVTFLQVSQALGGLAFTPFAAILLAFIVYIATCMPETRGKTVEEILEEINGAERLEKPLLHSGARLAAD